MRATFKKVDYSGEGYLYFRAQDFSDMVVYPV